MTASNNVIGKEVLRSVSRSFYLSMKVLPHEMREPVSLGYLLARATDTVADTAVVPHELRLELLKSIRERIFNKGEGSVEFFDQLEKDFIPHQDHAGEKRLLEHLPECFKWLQQMERADQYFVTKVLGHITNGQIWDVERFGSNDRDAPGFVKSGEELEQYTYRVAGSVGEFWTEVGFANGGRDFSLEESVKMKELGRLYGQGLQLVNVLRDVGEDLRNGRCYLPENDLIEAGWDGAGGGPPEELLMAVHGKWLGQCREWIHAGQVYAERVRSRRVRYATILPQLIAKRTVDLLEKAGPEILQKKVKVSRWDIRKLMLRALFS